MITKEKGGASYKKVGQYRFRLELMWTASNKKERQYKIRLALMWRNYLPTSYLPENCFSDKNQYSFL